MHQLYLDTFCAAWDFKTEIHNQIWGFFLVCQTKMNLSKHINPLTPMSDQNRISPYNINTISSRKVTRIKKNISILVRGLIVDLIPNSPN